MCLNIRIDCAASTAAAQQCWKQSVDFREQVRCRCTATVTLFPLLVGIVRECTMMMMMMMMGVFPTASRHLAH